MIRVLIVDDEARAIRSLRTVLQWYCEEDVEVIGEANSPSEAWPLVQSLDPDLIFLDIDMGDENGFMLLEKVRQLDQRVYVIFTTGHSQYAIEALRKDAFDYLLKPIEGSDLQAAVARVKEASESFPTSKNVPPLTFSLPMQDQIRVVNSSEVIRLESERNYTRFYLADGSVHLISKNLGAYEELLRGQPFFRSHKSHLINLEYLQSYVRQDGGYLLMKDGSKVLISRSQRPELFKLLKI